MTLEFMQGTGVSVPDEATANAVRDAIIAAAEDDTDPLDTVKLDDNPDGRYVAVDSSDPDTEYHRVAVTELDNGDWVVACNTQYDGDAGDESAFETHLRGLHTEIDSGLEAGAADRMQEV